MADHSSALHWWPIRRRVRHRPRDECVGRPQKAIAGQVAPAKVPTVTVSEAAAKAFEAALAGAGGDLVRLEIDPEFRHDLFVGPRATGDIEVRAMGVALLLDPASARRADGVHIDFVAGDGGGFKIDNPSEPLRVKSLTAASLKTMFDRGETVELFDVRTPEERLFATNRAVLVTWTTPAKSISRSSTETRPSSFTATMGFVAAPPPNTR